MIFGLNYSGWEIFYSYTSSEETYSAFESQFYTYYNNFQLINDDRGVWDYDPKRTVVGELLLENSWFYPFKYSTNDNTDFIKNMFRGFENLDLIKDKVWFFVETTPLIEESFSFFIKSKFQYFIFKLKLFFKFFKYMFNHKIQSGWKDMWKKYFYI